MYSIFRNYMGEEYRPSDKTLIPIWLFVIPSWVETLLIQICCRLFDTIQRIFINFVILQEKTSDIYINIREEKRSKIFKSSLDQCQTIAEKVFERLYFLLVLLQKS